MRQTGDSSARMDQSVLGTITLRHSPPRPDCRLLREDRAWLAQNIRKVTFPEITARTRKILEDHLPIDFIHVRKYNDFCLTARLDEVFRMKQAKVLTGAEPLRQCLLSRGNADVQTTCPKGPNLAEGVEEVLVRLGGS